MSVLSEFVQITNGLSVSLPPLKAIDKEMFRADYKNGFYIIGYDESKDKLILMTILPIDIPGVNAQEAFIQLCRSVLNSTNDLIYFSEENNYVHYRFSIPRFVSDAESCEDAIELFIHAQRVMMQRIKKLNDFYTDIVAFVVDD